ncbi:MAG: response regulator [Elusimicrobia bacterium]|nr:response regulator [Elusimicrobiota bacterium]
MKNFFTTSEVARVCGVAHTTVIRWITEKKLKAYETPGGHRRIEKESLIDFMKEFHIPVPPALADKWFRVLVVDDDKYMVGMIRKLFLREMSDVDLHITTKGMEALVMIGKIRFNLIILDVIMPDMDGIEVCKTLKRNPDTAGIKIIAITGKELSDEQEEYLRRNAECLLKKPFPPSLLLERTTAIMERSGMGVKYI